MEEWRETRKRDVRRCVFLVFVLCCRTLRSEYYLEANANFKKVVK